MLRIELDHVPIREKANICATQFHWCHPPVNYKHSIPIPKFVDVQHTITPKYYLKDSWTNPIVTFGNPPIPRARSSFKEPEDITRARRTPKNFCKDNIDSLLNSLESCETAKRSASAFSVALTISCVSSNSKSEASAETGKCFQYY